MWAFLADADRALGFGLADAVAPDADESGSDPRIDALVAEREAARAAKDFATSDRIRDELAAEGIELVDTPTAPPGAGRGGHPGSVDRWRPDAR